MSISQDEIDPDRVRWRDRYYAVHLLHRIFERLGQGSIIALVLLVLLLSALYPAIVRIIPAGTAGVIYKPLAGGTIVDRIYGEGVHVKYPWDTLYVYNVRIQTILHDFTVLTQQGLPLTLRLAVRFHPDPDVIGQLHKNVGPNYAETIIIYQIESVLRKRLGGARPEDIYTNRDGILTSVLEAAAEEVGERFVKVNDVIIRELFLPPEVAAAIEEKLVYEQREAAYEFRLGLQRQEAERLRIEAEGIRDYQATVNETLNDRLLTWRGIQATVDLARSNNAKVVVIGAGDQGLPLILGSDGPLAASSAQDISAPLADAPAASLAAVPGAPLGLQGGPRAGGVSLGGLQNGTLPRPEVPAIRDQVNTTVRELPRPQVSSTPGVITLAPPTAEEFLQPSRRNLHLFPQTNSPIAGVAPGAFTRTPTAPRYELAPDPLFVPHSATPQPIEGHLLPSNNHAPRSGIGSRAATAAEFLQAPLDMLP